MYYYGNGMEKDKSEAAKWYREAAEQGHAKAQYNLGLCLDSENNKTEAAKWYMKAAEQGYQLAQYVLGRMYGKGRGVTQNQSEAIKWYKKAADNVPNSYYAEEAEEQLYCIKCR